MTGIFVLVVLCITGYLKDKVTGFREKGGKMPKTQFPASLLETMSIEYAYEAFRKNKYIIGLPEFTKGLQAYSDSCREEARRIPLPVWKDMIWCSIEDGHNEWRSQLEVLKQVLSEECWNCQNAFLPLEMAGPPVWNVWAEKLRLKLLVPLGVPMSQAVDVNGFEAQMEQMEVFNFDSSPFLNGIFVENRYRFVEGKQIAGAEGLLRYVSTPGNDVLGVLRVGRESQDPWVKACARKLADQLYESNGAASLQFRFARASMLANGREQSPLVW